jgi:hypothetical protein
MWRRTGGSLSGWVVFGGALVFYISSLAPGIELWDTGEMQTDANALFIAHPTGFPLFILGGWLFAHLLPFGDPAWRVSLFAACATACAAAMLAVFTYDLTRSALVAIAAGLVFAPVSAIWLWAERADMHDLALACTAIAIVLAARAGATKSPAALTPACIAWGAALATHPVALFALPSLLVLGWPALVPLGYDRISTLVLWIVAPLVLYAYVPLRSLAIERTGLDANEALGLHGAALVDDGAPSSFIAFSHYIVATRFAPGYAFVDLARKSGIAQALAFAHTLAYEQYGYLALAFALVGFGALLYRNPRVAIALGVLTLGGIAFAANYRVESAPERYAFGAFWAISVFIAYGAWWLAESIVQRPRIVPFFAAVALFSSLVPTFAHSRDVVRERSAHMDARDVASRVASVTQDGSVVVATWTYATSLAYAKYVARRFGSRFVVSGWPDEYERFYPAWRTRYKHVYVLTDGAAREISFGKARYIAPRRAFVLSEYGVR